MEKRLERLESFLTQKIDFFYLSGKYNYLEVQCTSRNDNDINDYMSRGIHIECSKQFK